MQQQAYSEVYPLQAAQSLLWGPAGADLAAAAGIQALAGLPHRHPAVPKVAAAGLDAWQLPPAALAAPSAPATMEATQLNSQAFHSALSGDLRGFKPYSQSGQSMRQFPDNKRPRPASPEEARKRQRSQSSEGAGPTQPSASPLLAAAGFLASQPDAGP